MLDLGSGLLLKNAKLKNCKITPTRKPYCIEHLKRLDYVSSVEEKIAERKREILDAKKARIEKINLNGTVAKEILGYLSVSEDNTASLKGLARKIEVKVEAVQTYAIALEKANLVIRKFSRDKGGHPTQVLTLINRRTA